MSNIAPVLEQDDFKAPQRKVRRRNPDPAMHANDRDKERQVMYAPGLDVIQSQRHDVKYHGINAFPACTLVLIEKHGYYRPRNDREHLTVFSPSGARSRLEFREPGVIARRLDEKHSSEDHSGPAYLRWIKPLANVEDDERPRSEGGISVLYEDFGLTQLACLQLLSMPIVPTMYGAIYSRIDFLKSLENKPIQQTAKLAIDYVAANVKDDRVATVTVRDIETALAAFVGTENEMLLRRCITEMRQATEVSKNRLTNARIALISEMDSNSRNKAGKPAPDDGDKKICHLLGEPLPQVTRNVREEQRPTAGGTVVVDDLAEYKRCFACDERIRVRAKKCKECGEAQPELSLDGVSDDPDVRASIDEAAAANTPEGGAADALLAELASTGTVAVDNHSPAAPAAAPATPQTGRVVKTPAQRAAEKAAAIKAKEAK